MIGDLGGGNVLCAESYVCLDEHICGGLKDDATPVAKLFHRQLRDCDS